jgi:uncharacterized protein
MSGRLLIIAGIFSGLFLGLTCGAVAEAPSPEALTAARSLVTTLKFPDRYKALLPAILLSLKPALVQDRPEIERDYDAMTTMIADVYTPFYNAMLDNAASVYASTFTVDEMHQIEAFYRLPAGQKFLKTQPAIVQQSTEAAQDISRKASDEIRARLTEALRQKGHKL